MSWLTDKQRALELGPLLTSAHHPTSAGVYIVGRCADVAYLLNKLRSVSRTVQVVYRIHTMTSHLTPGDCQVPIRLGRTLVSSSAYEPKMDVLDHVTCHAGPESQRPQAS